jgi:hypothetical protein
VSVSKRKKKGVRKKTKEETETKREKTVALWKEGRRNESQKHAEK